MNDQLSTNIKVTIIQSELYWEDIDRNLGNFEHKINNISESPDIIVLPEMFNTGFTMHPDKCAEDIDGRTVNWLKEQAKKKNAVIIASLIIKESNSNKLSTINEERFYNRLIWMNPDGTFSKYDKRHLFRLGKENQFYTPGSEMLITHLKGWKFKPLVCYDLRFPVWAKNKLVNSESIINSQLSIVNSFDYDCLLYLANWPSSRIHAWRSLLVARAIENQSYVIGVNRIGKDGDGVAHCGDSLIIDYRGNILYDANSDVEALHTITLSLEELSQYRQKFAFALDWDKFKIDK